MYNNINYQPLNAGRKELILDSLESIERWDNAYHQNLVIEKKDSLMVRQSIALRDERILYLLNSLIKNTTAHIALNVFSEHIQPKSPRYNRAAFVSALDLIQYYDESIKELEKNADFSLVMTFQKQRNELWFFIFDYLLFLGGNDIFKNYLSKENTLVAA